MPHALAADPDVNDEPDRAREHSLTTAYINRISTAVPAHDVHETFRHFAETQLGADERRQVLFRRMADKGGIEHRYSCLAPASDLAGEAVDAASVYARGRFPDTSARMRLFEEYAPVLAAKAIDGLDLGSDRARVTHLVVTCCTGFSAPGIDLQVIERCGLPSTVERTMVGFMGCYAPSTPSSSPATSSARSRRRACWCSISSSAPCT
jgi:predicted naringenin-chalcone synthase